MAELYSIMKNWRRWKYEKENSCINHVVHFTRSIWVGKYMKSITAVVLLIFTAVLFALPDSLSVKINGDTVSILNEGLWANCCSEIDFSINQQNDSTLIITEVDSGAPCDCMCVYNLEVKITNLQAGEYIAKVYRWAYNLDPDTIYIGEVGFSFHPPQPPETTLVYSGTQSPCSFETSIDEKELLPDVFNLLSVYPNPSNAIISIKYSIRYFAHIVLSMYDIRGKEIKRIIDQYQNAGTYELKFNAEELPSGTYILLLNTGNSKSSKKIVLLK